VIEQQLELHTQDGIADAVLYRPTENDSWPGVLHLTDIGGIRDSHRHMAERTASLGYIVMMPNVFYRTGRPPLFAAPFKPGDEQSMKRYSELSKPLTPEAMQRDVGAYVDFLAAHESVAKKIGVVGYCFTGKMAVYAAALRPEKVKAVATFHGGGLYSDAPASPHRLLQEIKARLYFGHASNDRGMNAEAVEQLNQALAAWGGHYESEVYEGASHGWTVPDSPVYDPSQAEQALAKLTNLLSEM